MSSRDRFLLPLSYNTLVVESTTRCNARCGMCYQGAGPKGSDSLGDAALTPDEIRRVLRSAAAMPAIHRRFHLSGGEAFIKVDECLEIFGTARDLGFIDISCTSNAYWAADTFKARALAERLRDAGVLRIEISWDHWHGPHVAAQAVNNAIRACADADIEVNLRLLTTRSHSAEEALATLSPKALARAAMVTSAPVYQVGRALEIPTTDIYETSEEATCHTALNLTVNARGDVAPCCAGFDQTGVSLFGNVREHELADIAEAINRSLLIRMVVFEGIASLRPILKLLGEETKERYTSICGMCFEVFSDQRKVDKLVHFFEQLESDALGDALAELAVASS
jgi:MoaA/NifB/PqqE/SkfB family radical SAM enzyme